MVFVLWAWAFQCYRLLQGFRTVWIYWVRALGVGLQELCLSASCIEPLLSCGRPRLLKQPSGHSLQHQTSISVYPKAAELKPPLSRTSITAREYDNTIYIHTYTHRHIWIQKHIDLNNKADQTNKFTGIWPVEPPRYCTK